MKKIIIGIFILLPLLFFLWVGKAGNYLSKCYVEVSLRYKNYPTLFQQGKISQEEMELSFLNLRQENNNCQNSVEKKYAMPRVLTELLTNLVTKGRGLP